MPAPSHLEHFQEVMGESHFSSPSRIVITCFYNFGCLSSWIFPFCLFQSLFYLPLSFRRFC